MHISILVLKLILLFMWLREKTGYSCSVQVWSDSLISPLVVSIANELPLQMRMTSAEFINRVYSLNEHTG